MEQDRRVPLRVIAAQWARVGCIGFGGPPAHIALLRQLCVQRHRWLRADDFEDGIAATNLLPGPASTQLAIYCALRLRGPIGGLVGGVCFIVPGLVAILALSVLLLAEDPPRLLLGAAAGAGAAVAAVAVHAAAGLIPASWSRAGNGHVRWAGNGHVRWAGNGRVRWAGNGHVRWAGNGHVRWAAYLAAGVLSAALLGAWLVLVLVACGMVETSIAGWRPRARRGGLPLLVAPALALSGWAAVAWTALKVGALSYGGGFVIIPLMRTDTVDRHQWMSSAEFLTAVALGQVTPGPVVHTVAVVGYAAGGIGAGLLAAAVAFTPSFVFVLGAGRYFDRLRASAAVQAFLTGAGPAAIGAILGAAVPLALSLRHLWQLPILAAALVYLVLLRGNVVLALVSAGVLGVCAAAVGLPLG
jgi:chromate transporter